MLTLERKPMSKHQRALPVVEPLIQPTVERAGVVPSGMPKYTTRPLAPKVIKAQPKQEMALSCPADICVYGGAAGSGKSWVLLMETLAWTDVEGFGAVIFRRTFPEITQPGGLWDKSLQLYSWANGKSVGGDHKWVWPSGAWIKFSHMQHESDMLKWQGGEVALAMFDELTHFTARQFWYIVSRMRSTCGVNPYIRASCNPLENSWVAELISWWIGDDGFPIEERSGFVRYFVRDEETDGLLWRDTKEELIALGYTDDVMSFTFIAAKLTDNQELMQKDPKYLSKLKALPRYERLTLLYGNWKVQRGGGMRFKREWFEIVDACPYVTSSIRYWDRAGTDPIPEGAEKKKEKDVDHTAGVKLAHYEGAYYVLDVVDAAGSPKKVLDWITNTASQDHSPQECALWLEQDPASAGKAERHYMSIELAKFGPKWIAPSGSKWVRSSGASAASENGLIKIVRGSWNEAFIAQLVGFVDEELVKTTSGYHDDMVDAFSGAFNRLSIQHSYAANIT